MIETPCLQFRFIPDADNPTVGLFTAIVEVKDFRGSGSAYFNSSEIRDFAEKLKQFPIPADNPAYIRGGYWGDLKGTGAEIIDEKLMILIAPSKNPLYVDVSTSLASGGDVDKLCANSKIKFRANYSGLADLAQTLEAQVGGSELAAELFGI